MQVYSKMIAPHAKAILAAVIAGSGAGATAAVDGTISYAEWWLIASTALTALGAVYGVSETPHREGGVDKAAAADALAADAEAVAEDADALADTLASADDPDFHYREH